MLIALAIVLAVAAIWLASQIIGRTTTVEWSPIAPLPTSPSEDHPDSTSLAERVRAARESEALADRSDGFEAVDSESQAERREIIAKSDLPPDSGDTRASAFSPQNREREYDGKLTLPQKVYEGTSKTVSVIISPGLWSRASSGERLVAINEGGTTRFVARVPAGPAGSNSFEVELLAAGITVAGAKKQTKPIGDEVIAFHWNCAFPTIGNYEVTIIVRLITGGHSVELGAPITHNLRVGKVFGLPKQIIAALSVVFSIAASGIGVYAGGQQLNWW